MYVFDVYVPSFFFIKVYIFCILCKSFFYKNMSLYYNIIHLYIKAENTIFIHTLTLFLYFLFQMKIRKDLLFSKENFSFFNINLICEILNTNFY